MPNAIIVINHSPEAQQPGDLSLLSNTTPPQEPLMRLKPKADTQSWAWWLQLQLKVPGRPPAPSPTGNQYVLGARCSWGTRRSHP